MAIDTAAKRFSMLNFGGGANFDVVPIADGSLGAADRAHLLDLYSGILLAAPATSAGEIVGRFEVVAAILGGASVRPGVGGRYEVKPLEGGARA